MRTYLYLVTGHLFVFMALIWLFSEAPFETYKNFGVNALIVPPFLVQEGGWILVGLISIGVILWRDLFLERLPIALFAGFLALVQQLVFTLGKTSMVNVLPFYADPYLVEIDRILHFGATPWVLAHKFQAFIPEAFTTFIYLKLWLIIGAFFPAFLLIVDGDKARVGRFLILFFFAWVVLGNVIALVFLSCGPIFFDRVYGDNSFEPLFDALLTSGTLDGSVGYIQNLLWTNYEQGSQHLGTGISAFPSVHVGVATMFALYVYERFPKSLPICIAFVLTYLFLSVFLGWHYAVDGYFSILFTVLLWKFLVQKSRKNGVEIA